MGRDFPSIMWWGTYNRHEQLGGTQGQQNVSHAASSSYHTCGAGNSHSCGECWCLVILNEDYCLMTKYKLLKVYTLKVVRLI